jgi:hypothetical protein
MRVTRLRRRLLTILVAVGVGVIFAALGGAFSSGRGAASGPANVKALQQARLDPRVEAALGAFAKSAGVAMATVTQVGAVGAGLHERAAFLGADGRGQPRISFLSGDSISSFAPVSELISPKKPMWVTTSASGPSTASVGEVGLVGIVAPNVDAVAVTRADGTIVQPQLTRWHGYAFFSSLTTDSAQFPIKAQALSATGAVLFERDVHVDPLCPATNTTCV